MMLTDTNSSKLGAPESLEVTSLGAAPVEPTLMARHEGSAVYLAVLAAGEVIVLSTLRPRGGTLVLQVTSGVACLQRGPEEETELALQSGDLREIDPCGAGHLLGLPDGHGRETTVWITVLPRPKEPAG